MNKTVKDKIANHKLTDDQISAAIDLYLKQAESPDATDQSENTDENDAEDETASGEEESNVEGNDTTDQSKELEKLISKLLDAKLSEMKSGKSKPKITVKPTGKKTPVQPKINTDSFQLLS